MMIGPCLNFYHKKARKNKFAKLTAGFGEPEPSKFVDFKDN